MFKVIESFVDSKGFNGVEVAALLDVSDQVARKLLRNAEKSEVIQSRGTTNDKEYFF